MPKFENTYCSQCGEEFGPGDHGYSHCADHNMPNLKTTYYPKHHDHQKPKRKAYPLFESGTSMYGLDFACGAIAYTGPDVDGDTETRRLDAMCIILGKDMLMLADFTNDDGESVTDVLLNKHHAKIKEMVDLEIKKEKFRATIDTP